MARHSVMSTPLARRTTLGFSASVSYHAIHVCVGDSRCRRLGRPSLGRRGTAARACDQRGPVSLRTRAGMQWGTRFPARVTGSAFYSTWAAMRRSTTRPSLDTAAELDWIQLAQGLNLNLGYRRMQSDYYGGSNGDSTQESIDAGIRLQSRAVVLTSDECRFGTGSAIVKNGRHHQVSRDREWHPQPRGGPNLAGIGNVHRGVRFVETLLEPVFQDSFTAGIGGLVNRRVQFSRVLAHRWERWDPAPTVATTRMSQVSAAQSRSRLS